MSESIHLISSAGRVLLVLADDRDSRLRDIAQALGLTERAVQNLINELADTGLVKIEKRGRRNRYALQRRKVVTTVGERKLSLGKWLDHWQPVPSDGGSDKPEKAPAEPASKPRAEKSRLQESTPEGSEDSPQAQLDF